MVSFVTRLGLLALLAALLGVVALTVYDARTAPSIASAEEWPRLSQAVRQALFDELRPVRLENCDLARYGSPNDGGYLMCENLASGVAAAYSYGIDREDNWGCDVSRQLGVPIHQYDCFTEQRPLCDGGRFVFHDQCLGPRRETTAGQPFDTLESQIAANGDAGRQLLVKIDIEGAEWDALLATPEAVLDTFVQLPMELHLRGAADSTYLEAVRRLKRHFVLVNVHYNNWSCSVDSAPLPAHAFQTLWVNKRVAAIAPDARGPAPASALNAPDAPGRPDCQAAAAVPLPK
jgi:hypothetical protein